MGWRDTVAQCQKSQTYLLLIPKQDPQRQAWKAEWDHSLPCGFSYGTRKSTVHFCIFSYYDIMAAIMGNLAVQTRQAGDRLHRWHGCLTHHGKEPRKEFPWSSFSPPDRDVCDGPKDNHRLGKLLQARSSFLTQSMSSLVLPCSCAFQLRLLSNARRNLIPVLSLILFIFSSVKTNM